MAKIGDWGYLTILRETSAGVYLDAGDKEEGGLGDVLLPGTELVGLHEEWEEGDEARVFLYRDSEDRPVATLKCPKALPGEFRFLEAVEVGRMGAFLDWGLPKDLLLPFGEQKAYHGRVEEGQKVVVYVTVDEKTDRLIATQRLSRYLDQSVAEYEEGDEVDLLIYGKTDMGYKAIINDEHTGLLYADEVYRYVRHGEKTRGFVKQVREDGKVDLALYGTGKVGADDALAVIEEALQNRDGFLPLTDKSDPEEIAKVLGMSKKAFKRAVGGLYKAKKVVIEEGGVRRVEE